MEEASNAIFASCAALNEKETMHGRRNRSRWLCLGLKNSPGHRVQHIIKTCRSLALLLCCTKVGPAEHSWNGAKAVLQVGSQPHTSRALWHSGPTPQLQGNSHLKLSTLSSKAVSWVRGGSGSSRVPNCPR